MDVGKLFLYIFLKLCFCDSFLFFLNAYGILMYATFNNPHKELRNTPLHSSSNQNIRTDSDAQLVPGLGKYSVSPSAPSTSSQSSQESTSDVIPQTFGNMTTEGHMWYYQQPSHLLILMLTSEINHQNITRQDDDDVEKFVIRERCNF
ncbi:Protein CBG21292 [Caenorhabditis briggsae]|uniref:Protein CBG21292 n=1 Tax=Caenorhabditis briggsae TaxID=6238 RepID=A8XZS3_CAEBR|nr:Protein CBG21292 [Caenorhabditis briggsae]CAP38140.1 Protein CBG21292 [Caenorhabditis briggsae]